MRIIETLSGMIEDEIKDAEKYAKKALETKATDRKLSDVFFQLSTEELHHMSLLHGEVARAIEEYRRAEGDPPAGMLAMYEILHERHIEDAATVKILQNMYLE